MWYYTSHKINIYDLNMKQHPKSQKIFGDICENEDVWYCFDSWYDNFWDAVKWYGLEDALKEVSNNYKDIVFYVEWEWEENWDLWKGIFLNGKFRNYPAIITYPTIDINEILLSNE
jgi:hypothetical protein